NFNSVKSLNEDVYYLDKYRDRISSNIDHIEEKIYSLSKPVDSVLFDFLKTAKSRSDYKVAAMVGAGSIAIKAASKIYRGIAWVYNEYKLHQKEKRLRKRKVEIARLKIDWAYKALQLGTINSAKYLNLLKNELKKPIVSTDDFTNLESLKLM